MTKAELLLKLDRLDPSNALEFQEAFVAVDGFISMRDLAGAIEMSVTTLRRYQEGTAMPLPKLRPGLIQAVRKVVASL